MTTVAVTFGVLALWTARSWTSAHRARRRLRAHARPASLPVPEPVRRALRIAGLPVDPELAFGTWVGAVTVAVVGSMAVPGLRLLAAVVMLGPPGALALAGDRARRRRQRQLPAALDRIASGLRSGRSLAEAIAHVGELDAPVGPELAAVARAHRDGLALAEALRRWREHHDDSDTAITSAALELAARVGGPGAGAVAGAARSIRERQAVDAEVHALATQARVSATVLAVAPLTFAALLTAADPDAARFLLGTPAGWTCIAAGVLLDVAGAAWMRRLVRGASR